MQELESLSDGEFWREWRDMSEDSKRAIPATHRTACYERFARVSPARTVPDQREAAVDAGLRRGAIAPVALPPVISRRLADVRAVPIRWLWPGRIARGKVTLIAGDPGLGKSQLCLSLAAIVSTAGLWPVDRTRAERGSVVILSAEDDAGDTLRPRLEAADADLDRCHVLDAVRVESREGMPTTRMFSLREDLDRLSWLLDQIGDVTLVVIDPISAYLGGTDSHVNADVRALLAPLSEVAARHSVAIAAVSHLNKSGSQQSLLRVTGSLAFVAAARAAYIVARHPDDASRRVITPVKNNLGDDQTGYGYRIEAHRLPGGIVTSRVIWEPDPVTVTADEALAPGQAAEERSAVDEAADFLLGLLSNGPVSSGRVRVDANGAGHSWAAIRRAKRILGVQAEKEGLRSGWTWRLPPKALTDLEDAQRKSVSTFDDFEHLCGSEDGSATAEEGSL
ncbi:MAG: AAA family ATPase [Burkholderiales bacterium]